MAASESTDSLSCSTLTLRTVHFFDNLGEIGGFAIRNCERIPWEILGDRRYHRDANRPEPELGQILRVKQIRIKTVNNRQEKRIVKWQSLAKHKHKLTNTTT